MSPLLAPVALLFLSLLAGEFGYKEVKPIVFDNEKNRVGDLWVLDFTFRSPRYIMVETPGKGRQRIWYMTYTVVNRTGKPRVFIPKFTLVTDQGRQYDDVVLPRAEAAVIAREDPTQAMNLLNSVTISEKPIPPTPAESAPVVRHGVVFWEGVEGEPSDDSSVKSFTVFVSGLSNGYVRTEDKNKKETLKRKTLELKFDKLGDTFYPNEKEIRFKGHEWIYR